jgi:hypothetical protein
VAYEVEVAGSGSHKGPYVHEVRPLTTSSAGGAAVVGIAHKA